MLIRKKHCRNGFTLLELVVVVAILSIIAVLVVSRVDGVGQKAKTVAAEHDLLVLRDAFVNQDSGYIRDFRGMPGFSLCYLRIANLLISTNVYGSVSDDLAYQSGFQVDAGAGVPPGCAKPDVFTRWDEESERGWHGPYLKHSAGVFPAETDVRFADDSTFGNRGFYPRLSGLRVPQEFIDGKHGCSIYGFPGEPAVIDPWGNPYVLQIPPAQAFLGSNTNQSDGARFQYARVVSAGPDGRLDTPCFGVNMTNRWETTWSERLRRNARQAGRYGEDVSARGDDIVLFLVRNDTDEGKDDE